MRSFALVMVVAASLATAVAQEPPRPGAAREVVVRGHVVTDDGSSPVRRARVSSSDRRAEPASTDSQGRFELRAPAGGSLRVDKPGYVTQSLRRQDVEAGAEDLTVRLVRGAVVAGTVFDGMGIPAAGVRVRVRQVDDGQGGRGGSSQYSAETDDRGEFRVGNLAAGRYAVDTGADSGRRGRDGGGDAGPGRGRGERGGRNARGAAETLDGLIVQVRAGEEAAVAVVLDVDPQPRPATPAENARARAGGRGGDTASIRGRVLGPEGAPLAGASVQATAVGTGAGSRRTARSDAEGRYEIAGLAAGRYRVRVTRSGFTDVEYGQLRALEPGKTLALSAGSRLPDIDVRMPRGSVVTGMVMDAWGEPLQDVTVHAWQRLYVDGRESLVPAGGVRSRRTDDRGSYRLYGLLPGTYYIVASDESSDARLRGSDSGSVRMFYPGTAMLLEAVPIQVDVAQDALGIDMVFSSVTAARVSGVATSSQGGPVRGQAMLGVSARYGAPMVPVQTASVGNDGTFEFRDVAPGDYVVQVTGIPEMAIVDLGNAARGLGARGGRGAVQDAARGRGGRGGRGGGGQTGGLIDALRTAVEMEREFGSQIVTVVQQDVEGLAVETSPGSRISGEVLLEGDDTDLRSSSFAFAAQPSDPDRTPLTGQAEPRAEIRADWTFEVSGLTGPARFVPARAPEGWWLKSVDVRGINAAVEPAGFGRRDESTDRVRVVFASGAGQISGRVLDERREPVTDFAVLVFAVNSGLWFGGSPYVALATASQDGTYLVSSLPPAEYWAIAVDRVSGDARSGDWQRPEVLQTLASSAQHVAVRKGQPVTADLRLTRVGR